jgi:hypothetical protein
MSLLKKFIEYVRIKNSIVISNIFWNVVLTGRYQDCQPIYIIEARKQYDEEGNLITDFDGNPITEDYNLTASEVREKSNSFQMEMLII